MTKPKKNPKKKPKKKKPIKSAETSFNWVKRETNIGSMI